MSAKLEQPYRYTDPQNRRLTLYPASDRDRPYVWLEAEDLAGRTVTVVSVWLRLDQAGALCRSLSAGTRFEIRDHTGDKLILQLGRVTIVELVRHPVAGEAPATVRIRILSNQLPELRAAVMATAGRGGLADQAAPDEEPSASAAPSAPVPQLVPARADQLDLFGAAS
ncbi:hypothetical protein [Streptomyces ambofaciens]